MKRTRSTTSPPRRRRRRPQPKRSLFSKRLLVVALPLSVFAGLVALAPQTPQRLRPVQDATADSSGEIHSPFRYLPDNNVYALDFDPRNVKFGLLEGWDREQEAFQDTAALAYFSGPMYERHVDNDNHEVTVPLGDIKLGQRVWRGRNRSASIQRAYLGIRHNGSVDFSYGELTPERAFNYDTFIGGLHSIYNDLEAPPASYKGAYSISMGQRIRYYLPRIRMIMGLRQDGRVEVLMSRDGLTLEQSKDMARSRGLVAAYMPDHASKSRLIIPGTKGFTEEDANWISGGATSFVHVPYMLRLSERRFPLQGNLMSSLTPKLQGTDDCNGAVDCGQRFGGRLFDRALAGLNRLIEKGVEPIARLIWAPKPGTFTASDSQSTYQARNSYRPPLREPPITSDPLVLLEQPEMTGSTLNLEEETSLRSGNTLPLPPDLPPPLLLREGETLPIDLTVNTHGGPSDQTTTGPNSLPLIGAPPPPVLPPPPLSISDAELIN
ncbi:MAG: hypothetical protein AB8B41_02345 [Prochlorococcus sp.]|nr:hypothetical protein [Prochlorococcaceae cyanobacterium ETNP18_MAG_14]